MDDFTGFQFGDVHSSELGFIVVSGGDRYDRDLFAPINDSTSSVEGMDVEHYFGSTFDKRQFSLNIAYDNLEEDQIARIRRIFSSKSIQDFIFDEEPYKIYRVKCSNAPSLSFICFDVNGKRIYKGEGKLNFVAYYPFAISNHKFLSEYRADDRHYVNVDEWAAASQMKEVKGSLDTYNNGVIPLYNAGDIDTDYILTFSRTSDIIEVVIEVNGNSYSLNLSKAPTITSSAKIVIDTRKRLVVQIYNGTTTVINNCLSSGYITSLPVGESTMNFTVYGGSLSNVKIVYPYLYM